MTQRLLRASLAAASLFGTAFSMSSAQAAVVVSYPSFAGACGTTLTCVGNTAESGTALRLTPAAPNQAGAGYSTTAITLGTNSTFSTVFQFQLTNAAGIAPADGFAFVLARNSTGLGGIGGGLGYQGVGNSVAIEFDTYNNGGADLGSNHVAVDVNGVLTDNASVNPYGQATCDFDGGTHYSRQGCMSNGSIWTANIVYDGALLNVFLQEAGHAQQHLISNYAIDIASLLGTNSAFVGFTAATGSGYENQDILNWSFANDTSLTTVPEPSALALVGLALAAAGLARRKKA